MARATVESLSVLPLGNRSLTDADADATAINCGGGTYRPMVCSCPRHVNPSTIDAFDMLRLSWPLGVMVVSKSYWAARTFMGPDQPIWLRRGRALLGAHRLSRGIGSAD